MASKSASISQKKEAAPVAEKKAAPVAEKKAAPAPKAAPAAKAAPVAKAAPAPAAPSEVDVLKAEVEHLRRVVNVLANGFLRDCSRAQRMQMEQALNG